MNHLWHPFADMAAVEKAGEFVVDSGDGVWITDVDGNRYLDATAGLWFANVGHGRAELADAAASQMRKLAAYSTFGDVATRPTLELAERLADISPMADTKVFFTSGGSDSVETAVKLARRYWHELGKPDRTHVIGRGFGYHGMHAAGTSLSGLPSNKADHGTLFPDTATVTWDDPADLVAAIERLTPERVAAFICEPVIGAGGVMPPPPGYLAEVRRICRQYDVLFIADEVVTGYGRLGHWFASGRFGLEPDMIVTAKGLTSGYAPMGAVLVEPRVSEPFFQPGGGVWWRHGYTYSGHAMCAAVALANLDLIEREDLIRSAASLEGVIVEHVGRLAAHPAVTEVRCGVGALAGVQLKNAASAQDAVRAARAHGVSTRAMGAGALQVSPAFVATGADVARIAAGLSAALDTLVEPHIPDPRSDGASG